jgi:peptidoglycan/xylan/chitin deacetylase (PgdA/CDA1 family)
MHIRGRAYELFHMAKYSVYGRRGKARGSVTLSVDFEQVMGRETSRRELLGLDAMLEFSRNHGFPMTFAVVANIIEREPGYADRILGANPGNEIGSHSYSHKIFTGISVEEAEEELARSMDVLGSAGIRPSSFVFPRNEAMHTELLPIHGLRCYRSFEGKKHRLALPELDGDIWKMPMSLFVSHERKAMPVAYMARLARRKGLNLHIWCHPYNWGNSPGKELERVLGPLADYAEASSLEVLTMEGLCRRMEP